MVQPRINTSHKKFLTPSFFIFHSTMLKQVLVLSLVALAVSVSFTPIEDEDSPSLTTVQGRLGVPRYWNSN